jgi:ABC-2 type transport system permease protein
MKDMFHIISFEWKMLWRSNTVKTLLFVIIGAGIYGIFFGKFEIDKQNERIRQVEKYSTEKFDSLLTWATLDTTLTENKEKFAKAVTPTGVGWSKHFSYCISNQPGSAAGLCLGQRDLYPVYYRVNITDLSRQVNAAELANPMKLLTGNFDLSYVFIFLFPLLILSLLYNLYADESEKGTLSLLRSQPVSLRKILFYKGLLRFMIIWGLACILLFLGFLLQGISLLENFTLFIQWLWVITLYIFFWTLVMTMIIALKSGSSISAMIGLGIWIVFTLIVPALINLTVSSYYPLPNRAEVTDAVRAMNDQNWSSPSSFVLEQFYGENPEYDDGDTTDLHKWYYASFTLLDREARKVAKEIDQRVEQRNSKIREWEWLAPAAMAHERLSQISGTDRQSHQKFLDKVRVSHAELQRIYFARIFRGENFTVEDLEEIAKGYVFKRPEYNNYDQLKSKL